MPSTRDMWKSVGIGDWEKNTWRLVVMRNADGFTAEKPRIIHGVTMKQNDEGLCVMSDRTGKNIMPPLRISVLSKVKRGAFYMAGPICVNGNMHYQTIEASRE